MPSPNPNVAGLASDGPELTVHDEEHAITYMRMLDAEADGADWQEVCRIVLRIDPDHYPERTRRAFDSYLARAKMGGAGGISAAAFGAGGLPVHKSPMPHGWRAGWPYSPRVRPTLGDAISRGLWD